MGNNIITWKQSDKCTNYETSTFLLFVSCFENLLAPHQESSFCTAHNLFSQLSSRQVTSETRLGSHYHPFSGSHAQHANESKALHLSIGANTGHPRQMDGGWMEDTSTGTRSYPQSGTLPSLRNCYPCNCRVLDLLQSLGNGSIRVYSLAFSPLFYILIISPFYSIWTYTESRGRSILPHVAGHHAILKPE